MPSNNPNVLKNLKPFVKNDPRRINRPKGSVTFKTLVRQYIEDPNLADEVIKSPPNWWANLPNRRMADAIVIGMMVQAIKGDVRAATWVRDTGFPDPLADEGNESEPTEIIFINELPLRENRRIIDGDTYRADPQEAKRTKTDSKAK